MNIFHGLSFGRAKVRRQNGFRTRLAQEVTRGRLLDSRASSVTRICRPRVSDWQVVEVHLNQHARSPRARRSLVKVSPFLLHSAVIREPLLAYSPSISINSTQRLLYPHSLSYQPTTLTKRLPSISVSLLSKTQECGLPTMSADTSGSSVYSRMPL